MTCGGMFEGVGVLGWEKGSLGETFSLSVENENYHNAMRVLTTTTPPCTVHTA